jgi:predicted DsbA family dithiol-disulfide isomerase
MAATTTLDLQLWSDLTCPWCYLGRARLARALDLTPAEAPVDLTYRSFVLDPGAPTDPDQAPPLLDALAARFGTTLEQAAGLEARVRELAEAEGLPYTVERRYASSVDAHRLAHLGAAHGLGTEAFDALQRAYFAGRLNLADHEALTQVSVEVGLPKDAVAQTLATDAFADTVAVDVRAAHELGVTGVPFLVLADTYAVPGAAAVEVYVQALDAARGALV